MSERREQPDRRDFLRLLADGVAAVGVAKLLPSITTAGSSSAQGLVFHANAIVGAIPQIDDADLYFRQMYLEPAIKHLVHKNDEIFMEMYGNGLTTR